MMKVLIYIVMCVGVILSIKENEMSFNVQNERISQYLDNLMFLNISVVKIFSTFFLRNSTGLLGLFVLFRKDLFCICSDTVSNYNLNEEPTKKLIDENNSFVLTVDLLEDGVPMLVNSFLSNQYVIKHLDVSFLTKLFSTFQAFKNKKVVSDKNNKPEEKKILEEKKPEEIKLENNQHNDSQLGTGCFKDGIFNCTDEKHKEKIFEKILKRDTNDFIFVLNVKDPVLDELITREKMLTLDENNAFIEFISKSKEMMSINYTEELKGDFNDYDLVYPEFKAGKSILLYFVNVFWEKATELIKEKDKK